MKPHHSYGLLERWLHALALGPAAVREISFDLERWFALPRPGTGGSQASPSQGGPADGAVYVCGLARSGTTMLLRLLDQLDAFRSLTYSDMPFVLAPNLWQRIRQISSPSAPKAPVERAHGDGIMVDTDSPESFEQVFWKTFGNTRTSDGCLDTDEPSPDVLEAFSQYRALVANPRADHDRPPRPSRRYLSKNNNNLLRLRALGADPTAGILLVYRDPLATARSLHRQHARFCQMQAQDAFTRRYMRWLVHHEFGLDHLPFAFALPRMDRSRSPGELGYWLDYWDAVYRHVLSLDGARFHLVGHDALRARPRETLDSVFRVLGVTADAGALAEQVRAPDPSGRPSDEVAPELLQRAGDTYRALCADPRNVA